MYTLAIESTPFMVSELSLIPVFVLAGVVVHHSDYEHCRFLMFILCGSKIDNEGFTV